MNLQSPLKSIAIFLLSCSIISVNAQSLYEIKFSDKNNNQYKGFLVFFHENNAYIRTAYYENNQYNVVEINYKMLYGSTATGLKYCMLQKTTPPVFITARLATQSYNPDYFIWFYNSVSGKYDDLYTTDDSTFQATNYRRVTSYIELKPETLNDPYLREFFGSDEYKYTALKKMAGITPVILKPLTNAQAITKLHLIIVANTRDASIGLSCKADRYNLVNEFQQLASAIGVSFKEYVVEEYNFNKTGVLTTLNSVYPGSNDIVVFIYRGHGFRWQNQYEMWPRLSLKIEKGPPATDNSNSIGLQEVKDILDRKKARLNIVLGDCCNNEAGITTVTSNNFWQKQVSDNSDISKLRTLFMDTKGSIISAAAKPGEVSYAAPEGGLYSMSFVQALEQEISYFSKGATKWDNIFSNTIKFALDKSAPRNCGPTCTPQNGINEIRVTTAN